MLAQPKKDDWAIQTLRTVLGDKGWDRPFLRLGLYSVLSQAR